MIFRDIFQRLANLLLLFLFNVSKKSICHTLLIVQALILYLRFCKLVRIHLIHVVHSLLRTEHMHKCFKRLSQFLMLWLCLYEQIAIFNCFCWWVLSHLYWKPESCAEVCLISLFTERQRTQPQVSLSYGSKLVLQEWVQSISFNIRHLFLVR